MSSRKSTLYNPDDIDKQPENQTMTAEEYIAGANNRKNTISKVDIINNEIDKKKPLNKKQNNDILFSTKEETQTKDRWMSLSKITKKRVSKTFYVTNITTEALDIIATEKEIAPSKVIDSALQEYIEKYINERNIEVG